MKTATFLAVDFGAGSGRVIAGTLSPEGQLTFKEIHRFSNSPEKRGGLMRWDFARLHSEMRDGLKKAARECDGIVGIGVDTWGVDFGLIGPEGQLVEDPICYRETAWEPMISKLETIVSPESLYAKCGLQPIAINSIYRLMWMAGEGVDFSDKKILFMPDLFNYFLTGVAVNEYTMASTSGLLVAEERNWNHPLMRKAGVPFASLCPVVKPGHNLGPVTPEVARDLGLPETASVIAVGAHDTASAAAVVHFDGDTAFLSSGTWSLLGISLDEPVTTETARLSGYANEGGTEGILFLQNITGMWILQQLMGRWKEQGKTYDFPTLIRMAEEASIDTVFDVDCPEFAAAGDMDTVIREHCRTRGLTVPQTDGETVRVLLQSLAARYARALRDLESVTGKAMKKLQIIGGGSRNALLNRLTEEATGLEVVAGPAEATAIGNILTQIKALGYPAPKEIIENF